MQAGELNQETGLRQKFTGKERDAESRLDYFGARYYSWAAGRFTSPDEPFADQFPDDPQSWNLYGYGRNNPLIFSDPTGRKCVKTDDGSPADDGDGTGCTEAGVLPSSDPSNPNDSEDIVPQQVTTEAQMPSGLAYNLFDFTNGAIDSLSFGLASAPRNWAGIYVNTCGASYTAGEWAETAAEIALSGGSLALKAAARNASRKAVRAAANREMKRQGIRPVGGMVRHHRVPLFGHPGGSGALFPTGGLPASIHSNKLNIAMLQGGAENNRVHQRLRAMERMIELGVINPVLTGARAAGNVGCR